MDTRHLLQSKTFWFNLLTLGVTIGGILPPEYSAPVLTIGNVGLRLISSGAVNLMPTSIIEPKPEDK